MNCSAPIDIYPGGESGKCDLKCDLSFKYSNSACTVTNYGTHLVFSYDQSTNPPVQYNNQYYQVHEIRCYTPSLHSYNGSRTAAELVIVHKSNMGAVPLLICLPVRSAISGESTLDELIQVAGKTVPNEKDSARIKLKSTYNLNNWVPRKPFFTYYASEPYPPCGPSNDIIVFAPDIGITDSRLKQLQRIIQPHNSSIYTTSYFYNPNGPVNLEGNDIYIDCQPVDESYDPDAVTTGESGSGSGSDTFEIDFKNPIVQTLLGILMFIVILIFVQIAYAVVSFGGKPTIPTGDFDL